MLKLILILIFLNKIYCADVVNSLDYGGKVPSEDQFDLSFTYDADGNRECEVALKRPSEAWKTYAYKKITCEVGKNKFKALTLPKLQVAPVGIGYVIEVKILNNGVESGYKNWAVTVESGRQGFHIYDGRLFDANKNEFIIRGVNNAHAWYDNYNRWLAFNALKHIAAVKANTVRIVWEKNSVLTASDLDKVIAEAIRVKLIPMVELHDATGSSDANKLNEMARWFADNVWILIKYRKYILVNIANEWSPWGTSVTFWRDSYRTAISIIRNAGYSGTIVIDASAYAQNPNGPKLYGQELLNGDPYFNLIFSVHMYAEWATTDSNYNIVNELNEIKTKKIPFIIGEFADTHPARVNGQCKTLYIDARSIMRECSKHGFGYIGWSWAGNGNDDCGSLSALDIVANVNWATFTSFTLWGYELINTVGLGIRDTSKLATVF